MHNRGGYAETPNRTASTLRCMNPYLRSHSPELFMYSSRQLYAAHFPSEWLTCLGSSL